MVSIIKGDIIGSRKLINQDKWIMPLKDQLSQWGSTPEHWELVWGDFFQLEIPNPEEALQRAFTIKAIIKKIKHLDVRMAIGIGEKTYSGVKISESNGSAFVYAGEMFNFLEKKNNTIGIKSPWQIFDEEMNLVLKLSATIMDHWSVPSAELMEIVLSNKQITQDAIGKKLGIKQNSVSGRWTRANTGEILEVESMYRKKIKSLLS
jgi:hypothetical protein